MVKLNGILLLLLLTSSATMQQLRITKKMESRIEVSRDVLFSVSSGVGKPAGDKMVDFCDLHFALNSIAAGRQVCHSLVRHSLINFYRIGDAYDLSIF